ncbi:MAG: glycosyltransferase family 39 protein [Anaerolineae bacterium]
MSRSQYVALVSVFVCVVVVGLTWMPGVSLIRFGAVFLLLWILPGVAWMLALRGDWARRIVFGFGLAIVSNGIITLLLCFLSTSFPDNFARLVYALLTIGPALWCLKKPANAVAPSVNPLSYKAILVLLVGAALLRLPNLAYSEFQGDEAVVMRRAARVLVGHKEELFLHAKGPVEILTVMPLWALSGTLTEWQARLPYALAGMLAVAAVAVLTSQYFNKRAGMLAGMLLVVNGFLVAFGRIVQYQNLVVTMGALGLVALIAYARHGRLLDLLLSAVFIAYGLLTHYDTVLVGPAAIGLLIAGIVSRRSSWRCEMRNIVLAMLVGFLILGGFYIPFVLTPTFSKTVDYILAVRFGQGQGPLQNSAFNIWVMSVFYNSIYYVVGIIVFIGLGGVGYIVRAVRKRFAPRAGITGVDRAIPPLALLYFLIPFFFYLFIVKDPRTHIYTFYPGVAVLAGAALSEIWSWLWPDRRLWGLAWAALFSAGYILCIGYIGLAFVGHHPEYKRNWPQSRSWLYPVPVEELPQEGYFGFAYRAGWKAVEELYAQGILSGTYATNEEPAITTWYVLSGQRTLCSDPDNYIIAVNVQDEVSIDWAELERDYTPTVNITVAGQPKITVYHRRPVSDDPLSVALEDFIADFDAKSTVLQKATGVQRIAYPVNVDFGDVGRLLGYDLSATQVHPGDVLKVALYWQALSVPIRNYQVFVHLVISGMDRVAQHDGTPACAHMPTSIWRQGEIVYDEHTLTVSPDASPGIVQLYVGMYDVETLDRIYIPEGIGNALPLGKIEILPK